LTNVAILTQYGIPFLHQCDGLLNQPSPHLLLDNHSRERKREWMTEWMKEREKEGGERERERKRKGKLC